MALSDVAPAAPIQAPRSLKGAAKRLVGSPPTMLGLAEDGMTMLVVTHEMGFARQAADRIVFMDQGQIVETGPPLSFFDNPTHERTRTFLGQLLH
jgi:ABC-type polar amino acid transport system ATPase subunit